MEKQNRAAAAKSLLRACGCLACWAGIGALFAAIHPEGYYWPWALLCSAAQAAAVLCFAVAACGLSPAECGFCPPERGGLPPFLCCAAIAAGFAVFAPTAAYGGAGNASGFAALLQLCAAAPLAEEIVFRGTIQGCMSGLGFGGVLLQAAAFALLHSRGLPQLYALAMGLALGWLRRSTKSIFWCVILHILNNFIVCAVLRGGSL